MLRPLAYDEKYVIVYSCQALITLISYLSTNTSQVTHSMPRLDAKIGCQDWMPRLDAKQLVACQAAYCMLNKS